MAHASRDFYYTSSSEEYLEGGLSVLTWFERVDSVGWLEVRPS